MGKRERTKEEKEFYKNLGQKIKKVRIENGISQKKLANYLNTSQQILTNYEKGTVSIPFYITVKITDFLNISIDFLIAESGSAEEYSAIYKIDFESFYIVSKTFIESKTSEEIEQRLIELFGYIIDEKNLVLEHFLLNEINKIFTALKIKIPFEAELETKKMHKFIIDNIPAILISKNNIIIDKFVWTVNLAYFVYNYIETNVNLKSMKRDNENKDKIIIKYNKELNLNSIEFKKLT